MMFLIIWPKREREKEKEVLYISLLEKLYSKIISHGIKIFFYFEAYRRENAAASGYDSRKIFSRLVSKSDRRLVGKFVSWQQQILNIERDYKARLKKKRRDSRKVHSISDLAMDLPPLEDKRGDFFRGESAIAKVRTRSNFPSRFFFPR